MPESALRTAIVKALEADGHTVTVQHASAFARRGTGDLIVCVAPAGRYAMLEVKEPGRYATPAQVRRLRAVEASGGIALVVRSVAEARAAVLP